MSTPLRLLILEDNPYDAKLAVAMLEEAGYDCQWERVETQAEFLARLDAPDYDLILADYSLPAFDGLTALKLFRERDLDLPFILISGVLGEETAIESLKTGATDYVLKDHLSRLGPVVRRALREKEEHCQRKKAEEALRESEEKYRTLVEYSLQGLVVVQDFRIVFANAALAEITGYTVEELLSLSPEEVMAMIHPEDQALVWGRLRDRLAGKPVPPRYEYRGIRKDGAVCWLEMFATGIEYNGKPAVQAAIVDITERKQMEEALRESEEKFRSVIEQSEDGICITDEEGYIIVWNRSLEQITGLKTEEMVGWTIWDAQFQMNPAEQKTPETYERLKTALRQFLETGRAPWAGQLLEREYIQPDGTHLFVQGVTFPIKTRKGFMLGSITRDITERKRAEERLRLLSSAVEQSTEGIAVSDLEGNLLFVNNAFAAMHGYTPEELVGKHLSIFHTPEQMPSVEAANRQIRETGEFSGEIWHVRRDGTVFPTMMHNSLLRDEAGNPVGMIGTLRDITESKQAEEALRESEERFRRIFEEGPLGMAILSPDDRFIRVNAALCRLTGYTEEELVGSTWLDITHPEDVEPGKQQARQLLSGELPYLQTEKRYITKEGQTLWINLNAFFIYDDVGTPLYKLTMVEDITERKRMERLLQALNEAALAMERALTPEEIFVAVSGELKKLGFNCMVFLTDESKSRLLPTYLSYESRAIKAAEKLIGLQREGFSIPIQDSSVWREVVGERKTVFVENAEDVLRQVLPDFARGFVGQIKSVLAPLLVEDEVSGVFAVQSDELTADDGPAVTAFAHQMAAAWRKAQLVQDLQNSLEELKRTQAQLIQAQKMEALGQLAAGITHDFNNLLTPISGFAELLLWKAPPGSQQQEYLRQIKAAADRAAALTRQLRLFTRQARGERRPVQLNNVVEETRHLLERSIPKEIAIELQLEPELWVVEADSAQISQVVINLCLNACDAMPGGGTLTLETRNVTLDEEYAQKVLEARPGRYVRLSVSDTGYGMSPEVQSRLFEPFFTTKEVGKGTGLGLAVVYGIVRGHEGFINVYSEEGRGSVFHVYLPATGLAPEARGAEGLELPTGTETILLVDDEEAVRALGQGLLESCGYTVLAAEDGARALAVYQARRDEIDLVVLDVIMPRMSGRECLRRLREIDPQVKVLVSTGYVARGLAEEFMAEGALGVVEKPFQLRDFATAVQAALRP